MRIKLQPYEIVELVEERLAWLAVASERPHSFYHQFYRRAVPTIRLGHGANGIIDVAGVDAADDTLASDTVTSSLAKVARASWPELGEQLCYAEMTEENPRAETISRVADRSELRPTDFADGRMSQAGTVSLVGVKYQLRAFGELGKKDSLVALRGTAFAQRKCVIYQEAGQLEDGRSVSSLIALVRLDNGKLALPRTGVTLDAQWRKTITAVCGDEEVALHHRDDSGNAVDPLQSRFDEFVLSQWCRRSEWTVELSLSRKRTGIGLATDAIGARELARAMRLDGAVPTSRRKALLHWVSEHMRRRRDGRESVVRAHLRGEREFEAGGYWTTIWPSRVALEGACNAARFDVLPSQDGGAEKTGADD